MKLIIKLNKIKRNAVFLNSVYTFLNKKNILKTGGKYMRKNNISSVCNGFMRGNIFDIFYQLSMLSIVIPKERVLKK